MLEEIYAPRGVDPRQTRATKFTLLPTGLANTFAKTLALPLVQRLYSFAAAGVVHRFENFTEDLVVWVLSYGPERGEAPAIEKRK